MISDVLSAVRLTTRVFGRFELSAPWALRVPGADYLALYVIARGNAWLELEGSPGTAAMPPGGDRSRTRRTGPRTPLSAGDVVLLPRGAAHLLRDQSRAATRIHTVAETGCPRPTAVAPIVFGGGGSVTAFVAGAFRFGAVRRHVLLDSLPPVLHLPAGAAGTTPQVAATVQLILAESAAPGPGSPMLSARLADLLLVHALRALITGSGGGCSERGLRALADPAVGLSLRLIHGRPAERWSVERLAHAVGASRSSFAGRFTELVGQPPLQYLTEWRMADAAEQLRDSDDSVAAIAERVGYRNPAAFMKAFSRVHGIGPGGYRRAARSGVDSGSASRDHTARRTGGAAATAP